MRIKTIPDILIKRINDIDLKVLLRPKVTILVSKFKASYLTNIMAKVIYLQKIQHQAFKELLVRLSGIHSHFISLQNKTAIKQAVFS